MTRVGLGVKVGLDSSDVEYELGVASYIQQAMPLFSSLNPVVRGVSGSIALAFGIQGACAAVFVPLQTEKYYDLSGSLTFISTVLFSLYFPAKRPGMATPSLFSFHARQLLQTAGVMLWAGRLGSFLYQRIQRSGSDSRFDEIKKSPLAFTGAWMAQATWVSLTALPVFITNSIPASAHPALGLKDLATVALWVGALTFEVIADRQKSAWREAKNNKEHDEKFITSGLWSLSRHPNYVGEVTLWTAQFLTAYNAMSSPAIAGSLIPHWAAYAAAVSPIAEYLLIRFVSGVPLLEQSAEKKFGKDEDWQKYKKSTPVFFPGLRP